MRLAIIALVGFLTACTAANPNAPRELRSAPLYKGAPPAAGMVAAKFDGAADTCSAPRYLSGSPTYSEPAKQQGQTLNKMASFNVGDYAEAIACHCFSSASPQSFSYGNLRGMAVTSMSAAYANEIKFDRDAFYPSAPGNRYEYDANTTYAGKPTRLYYGANAGRSCMIGVSVVWEPADAEQSLRAIRFIEANSPGR